MAKEKINGHIYGNGPSRVLFLNHKVLQSDFVVVCNIPEPGVAKDRIAVIDTQPIAWFLNENHFPETKFWVSTRAGNFIRHKKLLDKIRIEVEWPDIHRYNNGIYCVKELLNQGYENIHLWGFDSTFSECLESPAMDKIIPRHRRPKHLKDDWAKHWRKLLNNRTNTIHVHMYKDSEPQDWIKHDRIELHRH